MIKKCSLTINSSRRMKTKIIMNRKDSERIIELNIKDSSLVVWLHLNFMDMTINYESLTFQPTVLCFMNQYKCEYKYKHKCENKK